MIRIGCVDIGTVTARLGVADVAGGRAALVSKQSRICDLGEGVAETGSLTPGAIERVCAAASDYIASAREQGATHLSCTLTSAARDASNSADLLSRLEGMGLRPQVIAGEIEGSLTFLGVAQDFPGGRIMVADNGGGSTELAIGTLDGANLTLDRVHSLDVGCRRVTELFLEAGDPPSASDIAAARQFAHDAFAQEAAEAKTPRDLVIVGGTATSLVAMSARLEPYDPSFVHLHELTISQVDSLAVRLAGMTVSQRMHIVGLQAKRAPVILGGTLIISELMHSFGFMSVRVSESDLLVGLAIVTGCAVEGTASPVPWVPTLTAVS